MNKRKLEDMTFEYFNDDELKVIVSQYLEDFLKEIIKKDYISKKKLYKHIEILEKENCHENCIIKNIGGITMELEIEEKLQEIYKNLIIEVNFKDFRLYEIIIKLEYQGVQYESKIEYLYDAKLTLDANISIIENIIDSKIILPFYKKGE